MHIKQPSSVDLSFSPTYSLLCSVAIPVKQLWLKKPFRTLNRHTLLQGLIHAAARTYTAVSLLHGMLSSQQLYSALCLDWGGSPENDKLSPPVHPLKTALAVRLENTKLLITPLQVHSTKCITSWVLYKIMDQGCSLLWNWRAPSTAWSSIHTEQQFFFMKLDLGVCHLSFIYDHLFQF